MKEIWKNVNEYEELYQVSNLGNVKRIRFINFRSNYLKNKLLKPIKHKNGYLVVGLTKNGKTKIKAIHRLVAQTFIDNPKNKKYVNHIDGNKQNNKVDNLEWCTPSENQKHAYKLGLQKVSERQRKIAKKCMLGNKHACKCKKGQTNIFDFIEE